METLSTSPILVEDKEYEIQHIGCNVCKPPQNEGFVQSPSMNTETSKGSVVMWIIIILIILLVLGVILMRRNVKNPRK